MPHNGTTEYYCGLNPTTELGVTQEPHLGGAKIVKNNLPILSVLVFQHFFCLLHFYVLSKLSLFFSAISRSLLTVLQFRAVPVTFILVSKKLV
jgi:hypothetical protein